jgi:hypothetical protein
MVNAFSEKSEVDRKEEADIRPAAKQNEYPVFPPVRKSRNQLFSKRLQLICHRQESRQGGAGRQEVISRNPQLTRLRPLRV